MGSTSTATSTSTTTVKVKALVDVNRASARPRQPPHHRNGDITCVSEGANAFDGGRLAW
jgi:hypothetical protein